MPIQECTLPEGGKGFRWGSQGHCYPDRADAEKQAAAAHANGWTGDIALDASARTIDDYGRMHISKSHISKAGVNPYYGREIPHNQELGLQPDKIYNLLRSPEELRKAAPSFALNQLLKKHIGVDSKDHKPYEIVGTIGSNVEFNDPYLDADTCIWSDEGIANIETDVMREFSCSYGYDPVMTPGTYQGQPYDGVMTNIRGNHLAQVEAGRAGSDVVAADSNPFQRSIMTKLGKAIDTYRTLAKDGAAPAEKLRLAMDAVIEATEDPEAKDGEPEEKKKEAEDEEEDETEEERKERLEKRKAAKDKKAKDSEPESKEEREKETKKAMDSAIDALRSDFKQLEEAKLLVRPVVGDVLGMDSALDVLRFGLKHLGVKHDNYTTFGALQDAFVQNSSKSTPAPRIAMDAATLTVSKIPGFNNVRVM